MSPASPQDRGCLHTSGPSNSGVRAGVWGFFSPPSPVSFDNAVRDVGDGRTQLGRRACRVYYHQGSDFILLDQPKNQLAYFPDLSDLTNEAKIDDAVVGDPGITTPEEERSLRTILHKHRVIFLGEGNALPPSDQGVTCDLDVGGAKPTGSGHSGELLPKRYELFKRLLETGLIEYSTSAWASAIVVVMKKNGKDIRLCIDYRVVNQVIKLLNYPLPLNDELMCNFAAIMWFMTLDMASGFWAVPMTARAKLISAFICPLGHLQWWRLPFGLTNAPLIYQQPLDNCLWGVVRLSPAEESQVDPGALSFLGIPPGEQVVLGSQGKEPRGKVISRAVTDTVFHHNRVALEQIGPVLFRSSYIDDIIYESPSWNDLCSTLDALLYRLRYWNISVSLPKSEFGVKKRKYLGHDISLDGTRTSQKLAQKVLDLPFPKTLKGIQSFLGILNYYAKFIEDLPVIAAVLYELSKEQLWAGRDLDKAHHAFKLLKERLVSTPLLQYPDPGRQYVIILHTNKWAISALGQGYDGVVRPVRFVGRVLQDAELRSADPRERRQDQDTPVSLEMPSADHVRYLLSFDGLVTRVPPASCGNCHPRKSSKTDDTCCPQAAVNEAEYAGMIRGIRMARDTGVDELVVVGDSRLAIQQLQGVIGCTQPHLLKLLEEAETVQKEFKSVHLVHVKREFNAAADYISKRVLREQTALEVTDPGKREVLGELNKSHEKLMKALDSREQSLVASVFAAKTRRLGTRLSGLTAELDIPEDDEFDAVLLRDDSWEPDESPGEFEVEAILDVRWITRIRTSRRIKEYKIKWKDYETTE
ncbi:unnamed protein product [Phytophthora fragariaefolia]|uniref:Unnamed protein product n=1 Tax=Phytophthora fragariaefolia TaxID=1490495 RepID=A0A9W6XX16_9STRA|nr:unnamed protein product [Phytophthora fragariaefolia]